MYFLVLVMANLAQSLQVWSTCDSVSKFNTIENKH